MVAEAGVHVVPDSAADALLLDRPAAASKAVLTRPRREAPLHVLYVGLNGVLHPSDSIYRLLFDKSCWDAGHTEFEGAAVLEQALAPWPSASIVLTSTQVWAHGLEPILERLGPGLAERVIGWTFDDLTRKAKLGAHGQPMSCTGYWSMSRSEVVRQHVDWLQPDAWIAVDDDAALWTTNERRGHCVLTDPCKGLREPAALDRLTTLLVGNFGDAVR